MSPAQAMSALSTIAAWRGTVVNHQNSDSRNRIAYRRQPVRRYRFSGCAQPGLRDTPAPQKIFTLEEYEESGILTGQSDPLKSSAPSR